MLGLFSRRATRCGGRSTIAPSVAGTPSPEFTAAECALLGRYFTNLDRPVFGLRNLPEVVKGALFSRYSRTEKSLRRVLLDKFINEPDSGFQQLAGAPADAADLVAVARAAEFRERVRFVSGV